MWCAAVAVPADASQRRAQTFVVTGLDPQVTHHVGRRVRVTILLRTGQPLVVSSATSQRDLAPAPSRQDRGVLVSASPRSTLAYARRQAERRRAAVVRMAARAKKVGAQNLSVYRSVIAGGGRVVGVNAAGDTLTAIVPAREVTRLIARPDVQAVQPSAVARALDIGQSSLSVGAPTWWSAGYLGGNGFEDVPANFSVDQDPVLRTHPAFGGIQFEVPRGAAVPGDPSATRHGTALLSAAAANGPIHCPLCQPADADKKGVAPGVSKVLDPSGALAELDWAAGVSGYSIDPTTGSWTLEPGAPDPAQVINYSRGADVTVDDTLNAEVWDASVDTYGVTATVAAGNSGPAPRTVNDPALAYNVIGVGAFSGGGTSDPSDDTVFGWSSRGPTVGGRKKPDLVAVGDGGLAYSYYESTGKLWKYDTGTSYAAPQVGGGAILLAGAGIRDPKVAKAVLIDSARPGRATPSAAMGTQVGWLPDWGWGELNLDAAYRERLNFARDEVPPNGARFFRATLQSAGDRATLVWNRRVADCQPLRQGCYYDTNSNFRVYTLSNLDLTQYDAATGTPLVTSRSSVDNVEQVRAAAPGNVVYKVEAGDVDRSSGEPFALAATRPLTPLVTPQPTTSLALSTSGTIRAGQLVTVSAEVANPSPDLTAEQAHVTLSLPPGVELVSGPPTQTLGTLSTRGAHGDRATATWTVRGTTDGIKQLIATAAATRYESTFQSSSAATFAVDATAPQIHLATPAGTISGTSIPLAWGASEPATYDLDVSVNGAAFTPWLVHTTQTSATYAAARGSRYVFRIRATDPLGNVSNGVVSREILVPGETTPAPPASPPRRDPPPARPRLSPQLRITRISWGGARLKVKGTVAPEADGKVTARWNGTTRGRRRTVRVSTIARARSFLLTLRVPRRANRARLTITYAGGLRFATQSRTVSLRTR
jgi:serine protease AprX